MEAKTCSPDLAWTAFLYVAGELPEDDRQAFEQLLAEDTAAQDAVVEAVRLSETIIAAEDQHIIAFPVTKREASRSNWKSWVPAAAAAVLLIVGLKVANQEGLVGPQANSVIAANSKSTAIYELWSHPDDGLLANEVGSESFEGLDESSDGELSDETSLEVPGWMLVAVANEANDSADPQPWQEDEAEPN